MSFSALHISFLSLPTSGSQLKVGLLDDAMHSVQRLKTDVFTTTTILHKNVNILPGLEV